MDALGVRDLRWATSKPLEAEWISQIEVRMCRKAILSRCELEPQSFGPPARSAIKRYTPSYLRRFHTCTSCKVSMAIEVIGDIMASVEVFHWEVHGEEFNSRWCPGKSVIFISAHLVDPAK